MGNSPTCCTSRDTEGIADETYRLDELAQLFHDGISRRLLKEGMMPDEVHEKRGMFAAAARRLLSEGHTGKQYARAFWVPGRVEVAGKHTDYAGGRSLIAAVTKGFAAVSVERKDGKARIFTSIGVDSVHISTELLISPDLEPQYGHWSAYPAVTIRRLARNFDIQYGADIAVERDLPEASGMSSSSVIVCLMWMVLSRRNKIESSQKFKEAIKTDEELYSYLGFIENGQDCGALLPGDKGVGTFGGSEDHTAIMSGAPMKLKLFSYCPTRQEGIYEVPHDLVFVIAVSGATAHKTGEAREDFNNAAFLARDAAAAWCIATERMPCEGRTFVPNRANLAEVVKQVRGELGLSTDDAKVRGTVGDVIATLDDGTKLGPNGPESKVRYQPGALRERFEQFFDESEVLVPRLARAFADKDITAIGQLSDESHRLTVECLRNTIPETAWLPQEARRLGAVGASAFGAGFGGSCWAVVGKPMARAFAEAWKKSYVAKFPRWEDTASVFVMVPGPGAFQL